MNPIPALRPKVLRFPVGRTSGVALLEIIRGIALRGATLNDLIPVVVTLAGMELVLVVLGRTATQKGRRVIDSSGKLIGLFRKERTSAGAG